MFAKTLSLILGTLLVVSGCGPAEEDGLGQAGSAQKDSNGLSRNGLSRNGLSRNGLSRNGLSRNGLSRNGLAAATFRAWFDADPAAAQSLMAYLARCALDRGESLTYTSPASGATYTWPGNLGLAPIWASGRSIPDAEQQLVTACLAAHVNAFDAEVDISVRGYDEWFRPIPLDRGEEAYTAREGCFYGNLFEDDGLFVGLDQPNYSSDVTTPRGCTLEAGQLSDCSPLEHVGLCRRNCIAGMDGNWLLCRHGFKFYRPISTRLQPADIYVCGDGVCQFTESKYDPATGKGCLKDCGSL